MSFKELPDSAIPLLLSKAVITALPGDPNLKVLIIGPNVPYQ